MTSRGQADHSATGIPGGAVPPASGGRRPPRLIWQIIAATFFRLVLNTARRFVYPFAPALSRELHVPLTAVTSLIALNQTTALVGLVAGPLSDQWGHRTMMRTGLALLAMGMLICATVPIYGYVLVGLLLTGLAKSVYDPAVQSFIGHQVPFARRGMAIGVTETAWAGSTLVGIPIMAFLIQGYGFRLSFVCMAVLGGVGWILMAGIIPNDRGPGSAGGEKTRMIPALRQLIQVRPAAGMIGFAFWASMANDNLFVVYGAWLERDFGVGLIALGLSSSVIGAAELLGESVTAAWADRIGLKRSILIGLTLVAVSYSVLPLISSSLYAALGGLFLIFLTFEFSFVCSISLSTELLPSTRATMMAGVYAAAGLGRMVGALMGGPLWLGGGLFAVAGTSALITVLAIICLLWGLRGWHEQE